MKRDGIEQTILALGPGELEEPQIARRIRPLFSRTLKCSGERIYLANHSLGRPLDRTESDILEGLGYWYTEREHAWERWLDEMAAFRTRVARLIHAPRADCVVPKISAGQGLRAVLNSYGRPLRVMASADEFNSIDYILKTYARRSRIDLNLIRPTAGRSYRLEDFLDALRQGTDLIVLSMVLFTTGQLLPGLPSLIAAAHERGTRVLLDLYHAAGTVPLDVAELDTDFAVGGCYKYLRGGPGAGWLYLHLRHLDGALDTLDTGWFAAPDPFAFTRPPSPEPGLGGNRFLESTPAVLPFYQARAGLTFTLAVGVDRLRRHSLQQQSILEELLSDQGIPFLGNPQERGAFIAIPDSNAQPVAERLRQAGIVCDAREGLLRLCPDLLNTNDELANAVKRLAIIRKIVR